MAVITLTISAAAAARFGAAIGYQATVNGVPNPQTLLEAGKAWIANDIKGIIKQYENQQAAITAMAANTADIDTNIVIT